MRIPMPAAFRLLVAAASLILPERATADPVLEITIDNPLSGRAVVYGTVERDVNKFYSLNAAGRYWEYSVQLLVFEASIGVESVQLTARAKHRVAPHPGEASSGLQLETISYLARSIAFPAPGNDLSGPAVVRHELPHPGSDKGHADRLVTTLDDLNGSAFGFMLGEQFSARLDTRHIPEPWSLAILTIGLVGLAAVRLSRVSASSCRCGRTGNCLRSSWA